MNEPNESQQKLERIIHHALRAQPLRTAPRTLEARVLNEIERRTTTAWSSTAFMRWPLPARAAFVLVCVAMAKLLLDATTWGASHVLAALRFIPLSWVVGGLTFAAIMYTALFGLGALAYRTLSIER
jgi:hypothetical protein